METGLKLKRKKTWLTPVTYSIHKKDPYNRISGKDFVKGLKLELKWNFRFLKKKIKTEMKQMHV